MVEDTKIGYMYFMCYFERHKSGYKANVMSLILVYIDDTYIVYKLLTLLSWRYWRFLSITVQKQTLWGESEISYWRSRDVNSDYGRVVTIEKFNHAKWLFWAVDIACTSNMKYVFKRVGNCD